MYVIFSGFRLLAPYLQELMTGKLPESINDRLFAYDVESAVSEYLKKEGPQGK
jgi:hypothetical protein